MSHRTHLFTVLSLILFLSHMSVFAEPTGENKLTENISRMNEGEQLYSDIQTYLAPGYFYFLRAIDNTIIELHFDMIMIIYLVLFMAFIFSSTYKKKKLLPDLNYFIINLIVIISVAILMKSHIEISASIIVAYIIVFINTLIIFRYYETKKIIWLFAGGMVLGIVGIIRHDIVAYLYGAEFWGIFFFGMKFYADKNDSIIKKTLIGLKFGFIFTGGILVVMLPVFLYFFANVDSSALYYQLIEYPAFIFKDAHGIPLPNPFMKNVGIMEFIRKIWFYVPLVVFVIVAFKLYFGAKRKELTSDDLKFWKVIFLFNLGINSYNQALIVSDIYHLIPAIIVATLLFYFVVDKNKYKLPIIIVYSSILIFI